jgi:hypothetical protein
MDSDNDGPEGPGFPIRTSTDQSLFAAPHGFSQRTTSFIACVRQGIHLMLLGHLITLIIDAHRDDARTQVEAREAATSKDLRFKTR